MRFDLDSEQSALRDVLRNYLEKQGMSAARSVVEGRASAGDAWLALVEQLDLASVGLPAEVGGTGYRLVDQVVVAEQLGRVVHPAPYLSAVVMAGSMLVEAGDPAAAEHLAGVVRGDCVATLAIPAEREPSWSTSCLGEAWLVDGVVPAVVCGAESDLLLVPAVHGDERALLALGLADSRISVRPLDVLDGTRPMADVVFDRLTTFPLTDLSTEALANALRRSQVVLAAEQVGVACAAVELASEYAAHREAFGRAIGSFQSIKHMLVDAFLAVDAARSATLFAAWATDESSAEAAPAADVASLLASTASRMATMTCVQVHGAIGFTWEHDAHLLLKRASTSRHLLGSPTEYLDRLARRLLDGPSGETNAGHRQSSASSRGMPIDA